jgi:cell division protein FtsX
VQRRLANDERVVRVRFVSKRQALAEMRRKHPELFARPPSNPLPDALRVLTRDAPSARSLGRSIRSWRGVALAKAGFAFRRPVTARRCL